MSSSVKKIVTAWDRTADAITAILQAIFEPIFEIFTAVVAMLFWLLITSVALIPLVLYRAWVVTRLWGWFVVPAFHLPALDMRYALGLLLIVNMFTTDDSPPPSTDGDDWTKALAAYVGPLFGMTVALVVGWIVKAYVPAGGVEGWAWDLFQSIGRAR
jgi:hypothetical protein